MKKLTLYLLLLLFLPCSAQEIHILQRDSASYFNIYSIVADSFQLNFQFNTPYYCGDIAISPDGLFYGIGPSGELYQIDSTTSQINLLTIFPQSTIFTVYNNLVCSHDYKLYRMGYEGDLYSYDLIADTLEYISNIPGNFPSGDLTFYKGNLVYQNSSDRNMMAYNLITDSVSTIFCIDSTQNISPLPSFWGNVVLHDSCGAEEIIGIRDIGEVYTFNLEDQSLNYYLNQSLILEGEDCYGAASTTEHFSSICYEELNNIDCSEIMNVEETENLNPNTIKLYPSPAENVLYLETNWEILRVEIFSMDGRKIKEMPFLETGLNIETLNTGVYLIQVYGDFGNELLQFVKR